MSSLIGQLPLAAIWFYCKDVNQTKRFYKNVVGLRSIEDESGESGPHFDLGTIRLTLLPRSETGKSDKPLASDHLVFLVENSIEAVQNDLVKRGVKMKSKKIIEDPNGKTAWFNDPDGHVIYLWQPPHRDSKNFRDVETLVKHYESVSRAVADLRQYDREAAEDN